MENLGKVTLKTISLFGHSITINPTMFIMTWLVMGLLVLFALYTSRKLTLIPTKIQSLFELIYEYLEEITISTLGEKDGKHYLPFILTLFIFILMANWIGVIPNILLFIGVIIALIHNVFGATSITFILNSFSDIQVHANPDVWYAWLLTAPAIEEPTKFISTDLSLGILVFLIVQAYGIRNKGIIGYLRNFVDDPFPMTGWKIILFPINPFFYLNIIGSLANIVSHSFRLWGNIFGGAMIIVIVSTLIKHLLLPVGLLGFFGLFAGIVQAFVFTMLAVTYIQQQQ